MAQTRIKTPFFWRFKTARLNAYQNALVFIAGYTFSKLSFKTLFRRFKRGDKHTHRNESHSKSRFGSWSASWLGSWFELCVFTSTANAVSITNRIFALRRNILFLLRSPHWLTHACIASARISKMHTHESRSERAFRSHVLRIGLSRWITIWKSFA